jgi:hypothetical protein
MQRILFIVFFLTNTVVYAQQVMPILSDEDTTDLYNALHTSPSQEQISPDDQAAINDSLTKAGYALKRLKDVINMKKDILWASTLSQRIRDFQDSTFILVSPLMKVQGTGVLIGLVSRVGEINLFDPIDPYITLYWKINPVTNLEMPFRLQLQVEHSAMLPDSLFDDIELAIQTYYAGKIYESVDETEDDIVGATIEFLDLLEAKVGDTYAPKYMFKVGGQIRRPGFTVEILSDETLTGNDSLVRVSVVDRLTGVLVYSNVTWNDSVNVQNGSVYINKKVIANHSLIATIDDTISISITIEIWNGDIRQPLESLLLSVLDEAIGIVLDTIESQLIRKAQLKQASAILLQEKHEEVVTTRGTTQIGEGQTVLADNEIIFHDSNIDPTLISAPPIDSQPNIGTYTIEAKKYAALMLLIDFLRNNRMALLNLAKAENRTTLVNNIGNDLGNLGANVMMSLITEGADGMKAYLVEYLTNQLATSNQ